MKNYLVTPSGPTAPLVLVQADFFTVDPGSGALVFWRIAPDTQPRAFQAFAGWVWQKVVEGKGAASAGAEEV